MQNLEKREKILVLVTSIAVLVFVVWTFGGADLFDTIVSGNSNVESREREFKSNLDDLKDMYIIEKQFSRVGEFPSTEDGKLKPALAFTQHISQMCQDLGFEFPPIRPETEEIDDVEEYELINVAVKTEGNFADTVKLLKAFEEDGLIFREIDLQSARDKPIVTARVTVARIAKKPESPRSRLSRLSR